MAPTTYVIWKNPGETDMIGKSRLTEKIYLTTSDKPGLNRKAARIRKSLDEVSKTLAGKEKKEKNSS